MNGKDAPSLASTTSIDLPLVSQPVGSSLPAPATNLPLLATRLAERRASGLSDELIGAAGHERLISRQ